MRMRIGFGLFAALVAAGISSGSASAAVCKKGTTSWTNPNGGAWKSVANWSNGLPSKHCDARITIPGDYGVAVGSLPAQGGVARSLTIGGTSGGQSVVDDNSACGIPVCNFDKRLVIGAGGIRINPSGALKMIAGSVVSAGPVRMAGGRIFGAGTITAKRGVFNIGGLLALNGNSVVTINGAYTQDARSTMSVGVPAAGTADKPGGLEVSGMMSLDGKLRINGPAPIRPAPFPVLVTGKGLFGTFADVAIDDQEYAPIYSARGLDIGPPQAETDVTKPVLSNVRFQPATFAKTALLSLNVTEAAKIDLEFGRVGTVQPLTVRVVPSKTGLNQYRLSAKPLGLKPGRYRLSLQAVDTAGNQSDALSLTFSVRRS